MRIKMVWGTRMGPYKDWRKAFESFSIKVEEGITVRRREKKEQ